MVVSEETLDKVMEFCNMKKRNSKGAGSVTASSQSVADPTNSSFEFGDFIRAFKVSNSEKADFIDGLDLIEDWILRSERV